jgi:hypothetical protein
MVDIPIKTLIEEFMPFTWFCGENFRGRNDIECALVEGTPGRDGVIRKKGSKFEHNVEITYHTICQCVFVQCNKKNQPMIKSIPFDSTTIFSMLPFRY